MKRTIVELRERLGKPVSCIHEVKTLGIDIAEHYHLFVPGVGKGGDGATLDEAVKDLLVNYNGNSVNNS